MPRSARFVAIAAAAAPLALALLGVTAWATGALRLASFSSSYIPMAPSTAIGFLLINSGVLALAIGARRGTNRAARAAGLTVSMLATIKFTEFVAGVTILNLEAAIIARPGEFGSVPLARMSPLTATLFLAAGPALTLLGLRAPRHAHVAGVLGSAVALVGSVVVLGYIYGAPLLYGGQVIPMALPTGLAFVGTGIALVALSGPASVPLNAFSGPRARARLLRVFLPTTVGAVTINGILTHVIFANVRANPALLAALFALVSALVTGFVVSWVSRTLGSAIDEAQTVLRQSREELEARVRERTAELTALNRELETFSYSVSHDLRAPLRHVVGFASILRDSAGPTLDAENQDHLARILSAGQRMSRMIDALLTLSRNTRAALEKQPIDVSALVAEVRTELARETDGREIVWRVHDPLPAVAADPNLFRLVLVNLISNAVKYTGKRPVAEIEIGTAGTGTGETVLFVRDNGAGFDMRYADKLFGVFQRLHRPEDFHGTGVGLANVQRIVQRHGGRAWAESQVDRGAVFYVALPAA